MISDKRSFTSISFLTIIFHAAPVSVSLSSFTTQRSYSFHSNGPLSTILAPLLLASLLLLLVLVLLVEVVAEVEEVEAVGAAVVSSGTVAG